MRIVLASGSVYRQQQLQNLGLPFSCDKPDIDETPLADESVRDMVMRLGRAKAAVVAARQPGALVLASDQSAEFRGAPVGKPGTTERAVAQLLQFSGQSVRFFTSLVAEDSLSGRVFEHLDETDVFFRQFDEHRARQYVAMDNPVDCAGGFKSEGRGALLIREIRSCDPHALIGLPMLALVSLLDDAGYPLFKP
jgi:septum formation protein